MAEFLIQALNETAAMRYWRGDIINVYNDGGIGTPIALQYVAIRVPGLDFPTAVLQREEWYIRLGFSIVSSDLPADSWTLRVEATQFNPTSNLGRLVQGKAEPFLADWGATGIIFADHAVTFTIGILDAIKSQGFWRGLDLTGLTLVEVSYDQGTGVHRCRANYSGSSLTAEQLKQSIAQNAGTIVSENTANKTITFDISRVTVRQKFEEEVKQRTESMIVRRKYRVTEAVMQYAEANSRDVTVSVGDYNTYWRNKLTE